MRAAPAILLVVLAVAGAGCGSEEAETVSGDGYRYEVPEGWADRTEDEELEDVEVFGYTFDTIVTDEPEEGFADNVNVIVEGSIAEGLTARQYVEAGRRLLRNPDLLEGETGLSRLKAHDFSGLTPVDLDGEEAFASEYSGEQGGRALRFRNVVAIRDGRAYGITYTALRDRFSENAEEANQVIETWTWR